MQMENLKETSQWKIDIMQETS